MFYINCNRLSSHLIALHNRHFTCLVLHQVYVKPCSTAFNRNDVIQADMRFSKTPDLPAGTCRLDTATDQHLNAELRLADYLADQIFWLRAHTSNSSIIKREKVR